jgi:hypothetical protein
MKKIIYCTIITLLVSCSSRPKKLHYNFNAPLNDVYAEFIGNDVNIYCFESKEELVYFTKIKKSNLDSLSKSKEVKYYISPLYLVYMMALINLDELTSSIHECRYSQKS